MRYCEHAISAEKHRVEIIVQSVFATYKLEPINRNIIEDNSSIDGVEPPNNKSLHSQAFFTLVVKVNKGQVSLIRSPFHIDVDYNLVKN